MSLLGRTRPLLVLAALLIGLAVWVSGTVQRNTADHAREASFGAQSLLTSMLDQETGVRGFLLTAREDFLDPYRSGLTAYDHALSDLRGEITEGTARARLAQTAGTAETWQRQAVELIASVRTHGARDAVSLSRALARKQAFDRFRQSVMSLQDELERDRAHDTRLASILSAVISLFLALLIGSTGAFVIGRQVKEARQRRAGEHQYRESQTEFIETMQLAENESEAHDLLRRHVERSVPDTQVVVLNRNNSADRLEPGTRVEDAGLAERLEGAQPKSCLAVRLGRENHRDSTETPLMSCELCGKSAGAATCRPLVVGSEVIGSVLVTRHGDFGPQDRERLRDSVAQAAPALANLRNLALAEKRAATDALTGLPNRRAIEDTLKRMIAQASRTMAPLSALMVDLDHFKTINDLYGHELGDEALAALGALLTDSLRESDFAGRQGGEEFIVLAPATDAAGAAVLGENLRAAIESLQVAGLDHRLTASIGVATFPDVAAGGTGLVRMADRALYAAKELGRNRVETAAAAGPSRGAVEPAAD
ncbi:MAG: diguanylate cyclase [Solirubrobacteraceae bacterium]